MRSLQKRAIFLARDTRTLGRHTPFLAEKCIYGEKYYDSFTEKGLMSFKGIFKLFCALSVVSFGTVFFALISW